MNSKINDVLVVIIASLILAIIGGYFTQLTFNGIFPAVFGVRDITFNEGFSLYFFARTLFDSNVSKVSVNKEVSIKSE